MTNTEILLGVGGGIAAYKSCDLLRRLQDRGYSVTVVPTPASLNFVGKATWEALSGKEVNTEVWQAIDKVNHVALAQSSDYILIAPATADLIARIAAGRADDLLTNTVLASDAPKMIVPAMHPKMWLNPITQENLSKLASKGFHVMPPAEGRLTGADSGIGRFPEVNAIIERFEAEVAVPKDLQGVKILITAGGTREEIDSVRFIGNRSTGKQGLALARLAVARGAEVTLIAANLEIAATAGFSVIQVQTTDEMSKALTENFPRCDVLIMAAAISDARPEAVVGKIKKEDLKCLNLIKNPDLLAEISKVKTRQVIVGFAAEKREELQSEGKRKLQAKQLDLIYANDIQEGALFGADETSGFLIDKVETVEVSKTSKVHLAELLLNWVVKRLQSANV
jgi:phosphopantothenoylcysteine decarboxylase/phosphopantothenate--cysteine ligase